MDGKVALLRDCSAMYSIVRAGCSRLCLFKNRARRWISMPRREALARTTLLFHVIEANLKALMYIGILHRGLLYSSVSLPGALVKSCARCLTV